MALIPGTKLRPYEIQSLLGAGGMGEVYRARDSRLERSVAIKILPAHRSLDPTVHARFEQEAKSVSALQHPNICTVHDVGSQGGVAFMVMEYVTGKTLDKLVPPDGLPTHGALKCAIQIADALACAHSAGFIGHRLAGQLGRGLNISAIAAGRFARCSITYEATIARAL